MTEIHREKATPAAGYPGPNDEVLEAQARVCTGPHQARPLGRRGDDPDPGRILDLILKSAAGELSWRERVSEAQMGAFFAAMTIRTRFGPETNWSAAERIAFEARRSALEGLPPPILFLLDPQIPYEGATPEEAIAVESLRTILVGGHLEAARTRQVCEAILSGEVAPALQAAVLIGQRMNIETNEEVRGYLDAVLPPEAILEVEVSSLTHFGEPFDGNTRYFHPTLFVAAVRAATGQASVLHGVDELPPKKGITMEQILEALGARTDLSREEAAALMEDSRVGFAYVSQREYAPAAYRLRELRVHIKKRPPWATTEKAQQLFRCGGDNYMVVGYYHPGYEEKLLRLMEERGFRAGLVVKGEEGTSNCSLRLGKPSGGDRKAVNYVQGFRRRADSLERFAADLDPAALGFHYEQNPRLEPVTASAFARAGRAALRGEAGHVLDRILLNAAALDVWFGLCDDTAEALGRAREAVASGAAGQRLEAYIEGSQA